jgi:hypothetical protein
LGSTVAAAAGLRITMQEIIMGMICCMRSVRAPDPGREQQARSCGAMAVLLVAWSHFQRLARSLLLPLGHTGAC